MKPLLYKLDAFDARYEKTITYTYSGNQQFKNICTVRNNETNTIVYRATIDTLQLKHTIPANRLTNGILYNITMQVLDSQNNVSEESTPLLCYCFTTPTFKFSNLTENQIVQNASYPITLSYNQPENEELQYYQVFLYNINKNQIWSSGVKYDDRLSITLSDLDDNGVYYVRAECKTINGMLITTDYIRFSVNYLMPNIYAIVTLENIKNEGSIKIQSNILSLEGRYYGNGEPIYVDSEMIDLRNSKNHVYFDEGFTIRDNFTINLKGYNFTDFSTILQLSNINNTIILTKKHGTYYSEGDVEKTFFELTVPSSSFSYYVIRSNFIDNPSNADILSIWIRRVNNIYDLYVKNLSIT